MATQLIDTHLAFKFLDENNCEITVDNPIVKGIKKTHVVSTQEVLSGILKFAKENKKAEPISIPQFNYYKSPSSPSVISYDYFANCNVAMVTVYAPPYDTIFKYKYKGHDDSSNVYSTAEILPGLYSSAKEANEKQKLGHGHVSALFKALDQEGIVKSKVHEGKYSNSESFIVPYIDVPWRWPGQVFIFFYKFNPVESNPYSNSQCLSYGCWYLDTDLFNGYDKAMLYPISFCNHHFNSSFAGQSGNYYNTMCFGDNTAHDIRSILKVVANMAYTDNNKDLFNDYDAITMLALGARGSLIRKDIIESVMANDKNEKLKKIMFNLGATGEAFNYGFLDAITNRLFDESIYTGSSEKTGILTDTYKYQNMYPNSFSKIKEIMSRIEVAKSTGNISNPKYTRAIDKQVLDILSAPFGGTHQHLVPTGWTNGIPASQNLKAMLDICKEKLGRMTSSNNFNLGG